LRLPPLRFRGGAGGRGFLLTPRPPSLRGQGERFETPPSPFSGRGWGRGFLPNPPDPFPERAGGEI